MYESDIQTIRFFTDNGTTKQITTITIIKDPAGYFFTTENIDLDNRAVEKTYYNSKPYDNAIDIFEGTVKLFNVDYIEEIINLDGTGLISIEAQREIVGTDIPISQK